MEGEAVEAEAEGRDKRQSKVGGSRVGGRDDQHLLPIVMDSVLQYQASSPGRAVEDLHAKPPSDVVLGVCSRQLPPREPSCGLAPATLTSYFL